MWQPQDSMGFHSIENGDPTNTKAMYTCRQPQRMHRQDCRIFQSLGHRDSSQSAAAFCKLIYKYGQVNGSLAEPSQLQRCIELRLFAPIESCCGVIRPFEVCLDCLPTFS